MHCPKCRRSFEAAGFCPYDGSPLVAPPDARTQQSVAMPAAKPPVSARVTAEQPAPPDEYDRLVGQALDGRYCVERRIGEGGMGVVFAARHAVIERPLAIKVLRREATRDLATVRRFVQEAKAASRIGHPNIVDVTDFGTTPDGMTYSVMELVAGPTLGAALRESAPFPAARAIKIAVQIARALGAAHDKGIVHRDLKPENVFLVDRDGRPDFVKIVDFGIAKVTPLTESAEPRLTRVGAVFGTPEYMAPEQAAGRSDPDGRVDIYALGVILYEMLVGRVPHRGDTMVRTIAMQMLEPAVPPSQVRPDLDIPRALESIVMKALAKKREQRYQTMGELAAALEALHETTTARSIEAPPGPLTPAAGIAYQHPISVVEPAPRLDPAPRVEPAQRVEPAIAPRAKSPTARHKHEPEFTTRDKPKTFEHVFSDEAAPPPRRRWPLILVLSLVLGGAAGALLIVMQQRDAAGPTTTAPTDAAPIAIVEADAAVVVPLPPFDAVERTAPADAAVVRTLRDGGVIALKPLPRDAEPPLVIDPSRIIRVQVVTKPDRARLFQGTTYRGEGGVTLDEPYGTQMELECRNIGYKPGRVKVVFDGRTDLYVCELTRIKICIDNIKNPFDDCELDPTKPVPGQPDKH